MNLDDVRTIIQSVEDRGRDVPLLLPGTVGQVGGNGLIEVVMDSDPDGTSIEASCLFADVGEGDRVMVLFDPPRGVYAVGLIGRTVEAGQLVTILSGGVSAVAYAGPTTTVVNTDTALVSLRADRYYRFSVLVRLDFDTLDTDPVEVTTSLDLQGFPLTYPTTGGGLIGASWGTLNAAFVGGQIGLISWERLVSLSAPWSNTIGFTVSVSPFGAATGDVDVSYEVAVYDAGPVSAVV